MKLNGRERGITPDPKYVLFFYFFILIFLFHISFYYYYSSSLCDLSFIIELEA